MTHLLLPPAYNVDLMARNLLYLGRLARSMPPSWDGAKLWYPCRLPGGEAIGQVLPGRGLKLSTDLRTYGITKALPNIYQDSITQKLVDILGSERGAITTYDGIIAARCGGNYQDIATFTQSLTTVASQWSTLFKVGGLPGIGTYTNIPGGAVQTRANVGALSLGLSNPGGSNKKYLLTLGWTAAQQINMMILADMLVAAGNISCNSGSSPYTISSTALTRYTSGAGVMMIFEVTTALSATADNINVTYTNQGSTGSQTTGAQVLTASAIVGRLLPVVVGPFTPLASGDYGVQSVQSATMSGANTGVIALNLYMPLLFMPGIGANVYTERDSTVQIDGITELTTASSTLGCLVAYVLPNTTSTGVLHAFMRTCEG